MRKTISLLLILIFLTSTITMDAKPASAQTQLPHITVKADGSVFGTDKIHRSGNTYTLTDNLNASIIVEKDNIVIDGSGFTINPYSEPLSETAISLTDRTNVTIENLNITGFGNGIALYRSSNCQISDNKIYSNNPIYLNYSWNNWIKQNYVENFSKGIGLWFSDDNLVSQNTVNNGGDGIFVVGETYNVSTPAGLAEQATYDVISGNTIKSCVFGGITVWSSNNTVIGNSISGGTGVSLSTYALNNLFSKNNIFGCEIGIYGGEFEDQNNSFFLNNITSNNFATLGFNRSSRSSFYYNNFINNTQDVSFSNEFHSNYSAVPIQTIVSHNWDNGTYGNYWSDYPTKYLSAKEVDSTGTYDTPYAVTPINYPMYLFYDYHPLINPVSFSQNIVELPFWTTPASTPTPNSESGGLASPLTITIITIVVISILAVIVISLLVYRRHRKTKLTV